MNTDLNSFYKRIQRATLNDLLVLRATFAEIAATVKTLSGDDRKQAEGAATLSQRRSHAVNHELIRRFHESEGN